MRYRSNSSLVKALTFGFLINASLVLITSFCQINLITSIKVGEPELAISSLRNTPWLLGFSILAGILALASLIVLVVLFCVWIYRVSCNSRALGIQDMRFSPGWAITWFFIPVANYFRPFQVVSEIWKASNPATQDNWKEKSTPFLIKAWWGTWLISTTGVGVRCGSLHISVFPTTFYYIPFASCDPKTLRFAGSLLAVQAMADVASSIFAMLMVRKIFHLQETKKQLSSDTAVAIQT